jgi:hypothetical protein
MINISMQFLIISLKKNGNLKLSWRCHGKNNLEGAHIMAPRGLGFSLWGLIFGFLESFLLHYEQLNFQN